MNIEILDNEYNFYIKNSNIYAKLLEGIMNECDVTWSQAVDILKLGITH